jgi:hypothetical protein
LICSVTRVHEIDLLQCKSASPIFLLLFAFAFR